MSGYEDKNFPAFDKAAKLLRSQGHEVLNPAELPETWAELEKTDEQAAWRNYLKRDLEELLKCEAVVVIDGWQNSNGSQLEVHNALRLKMPVYDINLKPVDVETILQEAQRLIYGPRRKTYDHPLDNFEGTAKGFEMVLWKKLKPGARITAEDVALMMVCLKISRATNMPDYRDNWTDMAGYAGCGYEVVQERKRRRVE